jgi:hypothetical protein
MGMSKLQQAEAQMAILKRRMQERDAEVGAVLAAMEKRIEALQKVAQAARLVREDFALFDREPDDPLSQLDEALDALDNPEFEDSRDDAGIVEEEAT